MSNTSSAMDVTARTLDLVKVVTDPSGAVGGAAKGLIQWLGFKSINSDTFSLIMRVGQDIALHPNSNGEEVVERMERTASSLEGLNLVIPYGALGRSIIEDTLLRWMPTTEAVILQYHDLSYATRVLCDVLLDAAEPRTKPLMDSLVQPIMREAVHSMALHANNEILDLAKLPDVLESLGNHVVTERAFAGTISALRMIQSGDVFVHMEYCAADVLSWIYHHWCGYLEVVSMNSKILQKDLGPEGQGRKLTVIIASNCNAVRRCREPSHERGRISVGTSHDSSFTTEHSSFTTEATSGAFLPDKSAKRSKLYDITERNPYVKDYLTLNEMEEIKAQTSALMIVRSLMALNVKPGRGSLLLEIQKSPGPDTRTFQWWTVCTPTLLQENIEAVPTSIRPLYRNMDRRERLEVQGIDPINMPPQKQAEIRQGGRYHFANIMRLYPEIADAMNCVKNRCECGCRKRRSYDHVDRGCRQSLISAQVVLFVAHSLAEAAGAQDISNILGTDSTLGLINATMELLGTIAVDGKIHWEEWFRLAASAITGLPQGIWTNRYRWETLAGNTPLCSISGSTTITPRWFEFDRELQLEHSWGVKILTGTVKGVIDETALIEIEPTGRSAGSWTSPQLLNVSPKLWVDDRVEIQSYVWKVEDSIYRHASVIKTIKTVVQTAPTAVRILSPEDVYIGYIFAPRPSCPHAEGEKEVYLWCMEEIIKFWPSFQSSNNTIAHISLVKDSAEKQNIAIGLASGRCILKTDSYCLPCLAQMATELGFAGICCGSGTKPLEAALLPSVPPSSYPGPSLFQPVALAERPRVVSAYQ